MAAGVGGLRQVREVRRCIGAIPPRTHMAKRHTLSPTAHLKRTSNARQARRMLESGHVAETTLAEATGYPREMRRLLQRRGVLAAELDERLEVVLLPHVSVNGATHRPLPVPSLPLQRERNGHRRPRRTVEAQLLGAGCRPRGAGLRMSLGTRPVCRRTRASEKQA